MLLNILELHVGWRWQGSSLLMVFIELAELLHFKKV